MAIINFKQGEDKILSVEAPVESPVVDFTTATAIKAIFKIGGVEQKKYSLSPDATYGTLEVDGTNAAKINFFVERIDSANFAKGLISVNLVASFPNLDFPDGDQVREFAFSNIGRVLEGGAKDEVIP